MTTLALLIVALIGSAVAYPVVPYPLTTIVPTTTISPTPAPPPSINSIAFWPTFHDFKFSVTGSDPTALNGSNPDFQSLKGPDTNIVSPILGTNGLPVYADPAGASSTTHGNASFSQWFTAGWEILGLPLYLTINDEGYWSYDNPTFFVLDGLGWGNQGEDNNSVLHNFGFCFNLHETFVYHGIEWVTLATDDDSFLFVDGVLVINNGGTHPATSVTASLTTYGFVVGNTYDFDLFYCERHTPGASFSIWTNIYFGEPSTYSLTTVVPTTTLPPNSPPPNFSYVPLPVTFHDFKFSSANFVNGSNPDFQNLKGIDNFIVTPNLSPDWWLPVYYYPFGVSATTHGIASFTQWYTAGWIINGITLYLTLNASNVWVYDNPTFFPLDGQGWGNQGQDIYGTTHNFAFCLTAHATFTYTGVEWFELASDDDAFLYINGQLLIQQGGTHAETYADVTLPAYAIGEILSFDLFYCERHTPGASLHLATNAFLGPATCQWNY